jgi:hypothetical protein
LAFPDLAETTEFRFHRERRSSFDHQMMRAAWDNRERFRKNPNAVPVEVSREGGRQGRSIAEPNLGRDWGSTRTITAAERHREAMTPKAAAWKPSERSCRPAGSFCGRVTPTGTSPAP